MSIDRLAGRAYTRFLAVLSGAASGVMLLFAVLAWRRDAPAGTIIWLAGALVFGLVARASWRSRARLSDVDFTGS